MFDWLFFFFVSYVGFQQILSLGYSIKKKKEVSPTELSKLHTFFSICFFIFSPVFPQISLFLDTVKIYLIKSELEPAVD